MYEEDPQNATGVQHTFSPFTSNTSLRMHLDKYHRQAYNAFCEANNCLNQLPSHKALVTKLNPADQRNTGPRPKYTPDQLLKSIVNFVIADDQASAGSLWTLFLLLTLEQSQAMRVVECPEFREIILLTNSNIHDEDIPRRTKVREAVLKAWDNWFQGFKNELQVSLALLDRHTTNRRYRLGVPWAH